MFCPCSRRKVALIQTHQDSGLQSLFGEFLSAQSDLPLFCNWQSHRNRLPMASDAIQNLWRESTWISCRKHCRRIQFLGASDRVHDHFSHRKHKPIMKYVPAVKNSHFDSLKIIIPTHTVVFTSSRKQTSSLSPSAGVTHSIWKVRWKSKK